MASTAAQEPRGHESGGGDGIPDGIIAQSETARGSGGAAPCANAGGCQRGNRRKARGQHRGPREASAAPGQIEAPRRVGARPAGASAVAAGRADVPGGRTSPGGTTRLHQTSGRCNVKGCSDGSKGGSAHEFRGVEGRGAGPGPRPARAAITRRRDWVDPLAEQCRRGMRVMLAGDSRPGRLMMSLLEGRSWFDLRCAGRSRTRRSAPGSRRCAGPSPEFGAARTEPSAWDSSG